MTNAIKYSPSGTEVTIQVSATDDAVNVEVIDQGYGIPEADLSRIFEKFYRVPRVQDAENGQHQNKTLLVSPQRLPNCTAVRSASSEVNAGSRFILVCPRGRRRRTFDAETRSRGEQPKQPLAYAHGFDPSRDRKGRLSMSPSRFYLRVSAPPRQFLVEGPYV